MLERAVGLHGLRHLEAEHGQPVGRRRADDRFIFGEDGDRARYRHGPR